MSAAARFDVPAAVGRPGALAPYLTLPQLFSLTWLAYPVLSLLFVAFRLHISSAQADDAVADAKGNLLTACRAAEKAATSAASLPRFLAQGTNAQIVDAVNGTLNAARATLLLALTIMQAIIEFIVDMYRSTFLCFLELVVRGSLELLIGASKEVTDFIQNTLRTIGDGLQSQISIVNSGINGAIEAINKVGSIFGGGIDIKPVSIDLTGLQNINIPNTFTEALVKLNSTIPTLDNVRDAVDKVIAIPFDTVKADINETFSGVRFDASVLPVPQTNAMSFCSSMDTSVLDRLGADLVKITKIAFALVIVIAFLLILGNCVLEWWKYRTLMENLEDTRAAWMTDPAVLRNSQNGIPTVPLTDYNLRELHAASSHPLFMRFTNWLSALCHLSPTQHINARWFFTYVFHPPALACFLIGLFGLISVELQLAAIAPLAHKYEGEVGKTVSDFTVLIGDSINTSMHNDSQAYATAVNTQVDAIQTTINDGMFGWVEETTSTLNNTLVTFYSEVQSAIEAVFGGTPLEQPMQEFMFCLIGTKVEAFEHALTFLHDNLRVDLPRASDDVLVISQQSMDEVSKPISLAAVGDQNDAENSGGLVGRLILRYVASLKKERIMFLVFLGLWGIVVLMALSVIVYHSYIAPALERRKKQQWHREARSFEASPWLAAAVEEKSIRSASPVFSPGGSPAPALGYSDGRNQKRTTWDDWAVDEKLPGSPESSTPRKLVANGRKHQNGEIFVLDDGSGSDSSRATSPARDAAKPGIWERIRGAFAKNNDGAEDWLATTSPQSKALPQPISPHHARSRSSTFNGGIPPPPPQGYNFPPPILASAPKPPKKHESVSGVEQFRFPPPPVRRTPAPMPLHHGFVRPVPNDMPRSPVDFLTTNRNEHSRKSSQTLAPPSAPQNPFSTPYDGIESSPFADTRDAYEVSPFNDTSAVQQPTNPFANLVGRAV
ncbi:hypothetical protein BKA62DRAFT_740102 [Auriculariales sp. MPI-PUGE-AT-0066]|nr:hypothetical protein BKA62DRAFT_740102 [Auriculariales sp. MPI-PUGE-AT-0066]